MIGSGSGQSNSQINTQSESGVVSQQLGMLENEVFCG